MKETRKLATRQSSVYLRHRRKPITSEPRPLPLRRPMAAWLTGACIFARARAPTSPCTRSNPLIFKWETCKLDTYHGWKGWTEGAHSVVVRIGRHEVSHVERRRMRQRFQRTTWINQSIGPLITIEFEQDPGQWPGRHRFIGTQHRHFRLKLIQASNHQWRNPTQQPWNYSTFKSFSATNSKFTKTRPIEKRTRTHFKISAASNTPTNKYA